MAKHEHILNPSMRGSPLALPLQAYLGDCQQRQDPADAVDVLRELIVSAGALPDAAPDGSTFLLIVASPDLMEALAAYATPPAPAPLPLFDRVSL